MTFIPLLSHYIRMRVLQSWLMVMFVLLGLDAIFSFIDQLENLKNDFQMFEAFVYVLSTLPESAFEFVSMAMLLACLIGLGQLAENSELIILRASGISVSRILWIVIQPVLLIILLTLLMAQYLIPVSSQFAESYRANKSGETESSLLKKAYWQREGNQFININRIDSHGDLYGITIFDFNDQQQLVSVQSFKSATLKNDQWQAKMVRTTIMDEQQISVSKEKSMRWETGITFEMLKLLMVSPEKLSVTALYKYGQYIEQQEQNAAKYFLAFWAKVFLPVSTVAMVLIAASFVFGSLRETPMGSRLLVGVVIALVFNQVQKLSSHAAIVYQLDPVMAAAFPAVVALLIGLVLIGRTT